MKKCSRCDTPWNGFRVQPHPRDICEGCGAYLHSCVNCHHFDDVVTNSCKLRSTSFVGARDMQNYCEEFRMVNTALRRSENRLSRARRAWDELFKT
jgi:hypothetical protein